MPITRQWQRDLDQQEAERVEQVNADAQAELDAQQQARDAAAWRNVSDLLARLREADGGPDAA